MPELRTDDPSLDPSRQRRSDAAPRLDRSEAEWLEERRRERLDALNAAAEPLDAAKARARTAAEAAKKDAEAAWRK